MKTPAHYLSPLLLSNLLKTLGAVALFFPALLHAVEIIVDNTDGSPAVTLQGTWTSSSFTPGYYGTSYLNDGNTGGSKFVKFAPNLTTAGLYEVFARWTSDPNRASNVLIEVYANGIWHTLPPVNQQMNGGQWNSLGVYSFAAGSSGLVKVSNTGANGYVIADAVKFVSSTSGPFDWGSPFGANLQLWVGDNRTDAVLPTLMQLAQESGIRWNRDGFTWTAVEPTPGQWNFDDTDVTVNSCAAKGIRIIGLLGYGHTGYGFPSVKHPPQNQAQADAFWNYVYKVVDRYKGQVDVWEVWNEPDLGEFLTSTDATRVSDYEYILSIAHSAIKAANPNALVLGPATSSEPVGTLQKMIQSGSIDYLDAISFHTYTNPASLEAISEPREGLPPSKLIQFEDLLNQNNIDKPVIVTETGFPTHIGSVAVSDERQAELIVRDYGILLSHGIKVIAGYRFRDLPMSTADYLADIKRNWGWLDHLTPKPALDAISVMASLVNTRGYLKSLPVVPQTPAASVPRLRALVFSNSAGADTVMLWSWEELYDSNKQLLRSNRYNVVIDGFVKDTTSSARDRLYDMQGVEQQLTSVPGGYALNLGPAPIYLTGTDLDHARIVVQDVNAPAIPAAIEIIVDNADTSKVTIDGTWFTSTSPTNRYGANYLHDGNTGKGSGAVTFTPTLTQSGDYEVYLRWTDAADRAPSVNVDINSAEGLATIPVNQKAQGSGGLWHLLGRYRFTAGAGNNVKIRNAGSSGYVVADAVRFIKPIVGSPINIYPDADTYVWDGSPNTNYGTSVLSVKDGDPNFDRISYLRFPLSAMTGSTVQATLNLKVSSVGAEGSGPKKIELHQLANDTWTETGTNWGNKPAPGALIATFTPTAGGEVWKLDVTSYVNAQRPSPDGKASFVLVQPEGTNRLVSFYSREDASNKPVLEVQ